MFRKNHSQLLKLVSSCVVYFLVFSSNLCFAQSPVPDNAEAEQIANGFSLSEGPYWHPGGYLLFSDVSENIIYKWTESEGVETFLAPSGEANGIAADRYGNILIAQHKARQIGKITSNPDSIAPLATHYNGDRFHSPNDLTVKSDGAVFFTDPPWGGNPSEINFHGVYRIPANGGPVQLLVDDLSYPNGIAFSPDESKLYVSETLSSNIHVYDVIDDSTLANGSIFATVNEHGNNGQNGSDGIKVDNNGNVWATGSEGVAVFAPNGDLLDIINVPGETTNLGWGGTDSLILFITNFSGLYKVDLGPLSRPAAPGNLQTSESDSGVTLTWEGSGESIKYISVYRSTNDGPFEKVMAAPYTNTVTDSNDISANSYTYKVTATDVMGFESDFSNEAGAVVTGLKESTNHLDGYELKQNYPNPFNPTTKIAFSLARTGQAALKIYNITGQLVDAILDQKMSAGNYVVEWNASQFPSGFYIYTLETEHKRFSRKLLLVK